MQLSNFAMLNRVIRPHRDADEEQCAHSWLCAIPPQPFSLRPGLPIHRRARMPLTDRVRLWEKIRGS